MGLLLQNLEGDAHVIWPTPKFNIPAPAEAKIPVDFSMI